MIYALDFSPKQKVLVGAIGLRVEELQITIISSSFIIPWVVDPMVWLEMLSEMIFANKRINARILYVIRI